MPSVCYKSLIKSFPLREYHSVVHALNDMIIGVLVAAVLMRLQQVG